VSWQALCQRFLQETDPHGDLRGLVSLESRVLARDLIGPEQIEAFLAATEPKLHELEQMLRDRRACHFVKCLMNASGYVPESFFEALIVAASGVEGASFHRHFVFPCMARFGIDRTRQALEVRRQDADPDERRRLSFALYWARCYHPRDWPPRLPPPAGS
jgi:hypothetical protein